MIQKKKVPLHPSRPSSTRITAFVDLQRLHNNFRILRRESGQRDILAMVKANAYGHGATAVARSLLKEPGLAGFGVATLQEGAELRMGLGASRTNPKILVFSDCTPWETWKRSFCQKHHLTPVLTSLEDFNHFIRQGAHRTLPYHLKFNTGMNRLGIDMEEVSDLARVLDQLEHRHQPQGWMTHLAHSEKPNHPLSRLQLQRFQELRGRFWQKHDASDWHFANSAAIWNARAWKVEDQSTLVRPGLALYGIPPWTDAPQRGLKPVMRVEVRIIQIHQVAAGQGVGYGFTFRPKTSTRVGIISAGYADGMHRLLSSKGWVYAGTRRPLLGRVSMDLMAASLPPSTKTGDWVELWGDHLDLWKQAQAAQTVPYELLTSLSDRVERRYVDGSRS